MFKRYENNNHIVLAIAAISAIGLALILLFAPLKSAVIVLNAVFAGSICGIIFAYWDLMKATMIGAPPFDRARQYALGVFAAWIAICFFISTSIFAQITGDNARTPYTMGIAARYVAIIGAWLQVTAPDFGDGFFGSAERRVLWIAVGLSAIASIVLIILQT